MRKKYKNSKESMIDSIQRGSKEQWKSSNGAVMPAFKQINDEELKILEKWILSTS